MKAAIAIGLLAGTMAAMPAEAASRAFTIRNTNDKAAVQKVWQTPSGDSAPWQEVPLDYPIKPSAGSPFTMPDGDICLYDIKVEFSDQATRQYRNVNVCRNDTVKVS